MVYIGRTDRKLFTKEYERMLVTERYAQFLLFLSIRLTENIFILNGVQLPDHVTTRHPRQSWKSGTLQTGRSLDISN